MIMLKWMIEKILNKLEQKCKVKSQFVKYEEITQFIHKLCYKAKAAWFIEQCTVKLVSGPTKKFFLIFCHFIQWPLTN